MQRVGLVGAGYIASWHSDALRRIPNVKLSAICDIDRERAEAFASEKGISAFADLDEMLQANACDIMHVLTPPQHHFQTAAKILNAGRHHLLIEKPMCLSSADCETLSALANAQSVKVACNHNFLYLPCVEQLKAVLERDELGKIDCLTIDWMFPLGQLSGGPFNSWLFDKPTNLLFELAPHLVSATEYLVGPLRDELVRAENPLSLPNGNLAYRRWRIMATAGESIGVDIRLSLVTAHPKRSIEVRALGGVAACDLERDIFSVVKPNSSGLFFEPLVAARSMASQLSRASRRNFHTQLKSLNKLAPFGLSLCRSIDAFYASLSVDQVESRQSATLGTAVMAGIERIASAVTYMPPARPAEVTPAAPPSPASQQRASVLVLGGTGFIGAELVSRLCKSGRRVRVMSRNAQRSTDPQVEFCSGSYGDLESLKKGMDGVDVVYHLARSNSDTFNDYIRRDVLPTKAVGECCIAAKVRRLIYVGTIDSLNVRNHGQPVTEIDSVDPKIARRNPYARSKAMSEAVLRQLEVEGLNLVVARPGIVIGKNSAPQHWGVGMWPNPTTCLFWGNGEIKLPLVLVEDVADALARMMDAQGIDGHDFNLVGPPLMSAKEYVDAMNAIPGMHVTATPRSIIRYFTADFIKYIVKRAVGRSAVSPSYDDWLSRTQRSGISGKKAMEVLGWRPTESPEALSKDGIGQPVQWYLR